MSATNSTTNYNLPIFIASDSPKWLVDWNGAMNTIDSAINTVATAASGAAGDITTLQSDLQTLSGTVTTQGTSISTLTSSLSTLTGTVNTITSLIGNGEPTTTDKTIIGAINELHADIQQIVVSVDADDVSYDNTTSQLLATNVQSAIDELKVDIDNIVIPTPQNQSRRYIVISDSYGLVRGNNTPFTELLPTLLGTSASEYYTYSEGAMGYARTGSDGHVAESLLTAHASDIADRGTITDIIFALGVNDTYSTAAAINSAIDSLVSYCHTTYPNASIYMGYIGNIQDKSDATVRAGYYASVEAITNRAMKNGVKLISGVEYIMHNGAFFQSDGVHPNDDGCVAIANFIYDFLMGSNPIYRHRTTAALTSTNMSNCRYEITIEGELTFIRIVPGNTTAAISVPDRSFVTLGTDTNKILSFYGDSQRLIPATCPVGASYETVYYYLNANTLQIQYPNGSSGDSIASGVAPYATTVVFPTLIV